MVPISFPSKHFFGIEKVHRIFILSLLSDDCKRFGEEEFLQKAAAKIFPVKIIHKINVMSQK
jgi:hypothetical protein